MTEITEKDRGHRAAPDEVRPPALRPVLLHYAIARHGEDGLRLLHIPLEFDEEALVVFSSSRTAKRYFLSNIFSASWYMRECSGGELVSLLLGPYEGIEWVLLDPLSDCLSVGGTATNLIRRERFVDHLLG